MSVQFFNGDDGCQLPINFNDPTQGSVGGQNSFGFQEGWPVRKKLFFRLNTNREAASRLEITVFHPSLPIEVNLCPSPKKQRHKELFVHYDSKDTHHTHQTMGSLLFCCKGDHHKCPWSDTARSGCQVKAPSAVRLRFRLFYNDTDDSTDIISKPFRIQVKRNNIRMTRERYPSQRTPALFAHYPKAHIQPEFAPQAAIYHDTQAMAHTLAFECPATLTQPFTHMIPETPEEELWLRRLNEEFENALPTSLSFGDKDEDVAPEGFIALDGFIFDFAPIEE